MTEEGILEVFSPWRADPSSGRCDCRRPRGRRRPARGTQRLLWGGRGRSAAGVGGRVCCPSADRSGMGGEREVRSGGMEGSGMGVASVGVAAVVGVCGVVVAFTLVAFWRCVCASPRTPATTPRLDHPGVGLR